MQTLTRPKSHIGLAMSPISSGIPAPFPREEFLQTQQVESFSEQDGPQAGPSHTSEADDVRHIAPRGMLTELMPSITYVQKSCIMTLNDLLSMPTRWSPIVPDRRHSMPHVTPTSQFGVESSSSALQTLVTNLRNRNGAKEMIEVSNDTELIQELCSHVQSISPSLEPEDAILASSLASLLSHFDRLSRMQMNSASLVTQSPDVAPWENSGPSDLFDMLKRQLSDLQFERLSLQPKFLNPGSSPVLAVEAALIWHRIDEELDAIVAMCKERTEGVHIHSLDGLPPQYQRDEYESEKLPSYDESDGRPSIDSSKPESSLSSPLMVGRQMDEKMRLDLENVAVAIERLYVVAPQLHNQRVELKSSKLEQLEKASREGGKISQGKQKERDIRELEHILEMLTRASQRSLSNQSVLLEGGLPGITEKARQKDIAKKEAFVEHVEQLALYSDAGRLHKQDAVLPSKTKDPHTLLSLPEFIREPLPVGSRTLPTDHLTLLTLPEFVKEYPHPSFDEINPQLPEIKKAKKNNRLRSSSAPSLSWLLSSPSKSGSNNSTLSRARSRPGLHISLTVPSVRFEVSYVAENHENLRHVLVFFSLTSTAPSANIEAEVLSPLPGNVNQGSDRLLLSSGSRTSPPLILPTCVRPGKQVVTRQGDYFEIKLITMVPQAPAHVEDIPPLLDAAQLSSINPTSFICASCSLPLVQSSKVWEYRDLPSEHWAELVEAWMCHTDQKLHDEAVKHGQSGFWPQTGQALVGGSYILFEESSLTLQNLHHAEENKHGGDWRLVRCLCGAVIGRSQDHPVGAGLRRPTFRLLKFAIRPVSQTSEQFKIPLSAFIVEDMIELVQAHATYRFVILDEEDELPRILIWLFKPSIQLSYATSGTHSIPTSASIHAAKVLFKILSPSERLMDVKTILNQYPGFPQAEYLFYPMPICRRLASLLRESNSVYPQGLRMMTGLQLGWLHRA